MSPATAVPVTVGRATLVMPSVGIPLSLPGASVGGAGVGGAVVVIAQRAGWVDHDAGRVGLIAGHVGDGRAVQVQAGDSQVVGVLPVRDRCRALLLSCRSARSRS